jgi:hypothetical protein
VTGELNVRTLTVCDDPLRYASLRAEPDWQVLGKRLGKAMAAVGGSSSVLQQGRGWRSRGWLAASALTSARLPDPWPLEPEALAP